MPRDRRYLVKELFGPTLQGEGAHAGMPCVFLRFAHCNLACTFCDTDFSPEGAARLLAGEIVERLLALDEHGSRRVVVTGGEPALQWDAPLAAALRDAGFRTHMETNGTRPLAAPVDWLTVSPKPHFHPASETLQIEAANECKVVIDGHVTESDLERYESMQFDSYYLQPCMDEHYETHLRETLSLCHRRPQWRLSLQIHKILGLP